MRFNLKKDQKRILNLLKKNYDYIIIGSGPSGCVLANELSETNKNILLIEEGGIFNPKKIKRRKVVSKNLKIKKESAVVAFGGASNTWGSGSSYFEKFEMSNLKNSKNLWPVKHNMLMKLYDKVERKYNIKFPKNKKSRKFNDFYERSFYANINPINFSNFIDESKVDILLNARVKYINEKKNISKCEILVGKDNYQIQGGKIILCCGCLENIKLINRSYNEKKIKKINIKILGRYFMNHPKINIGEIKFPKKKINYDKYIFYPTSSSYFGISLNPEFRNKKKLLNSFVRLVPKKKSMKNKLYFKIYNKIKEKLNINKGSNFIIKFFFEMEPSYSNKVQYDKKRDQIVVDYKFSKSDIKTVVILSDKILKYFSSNYKKEKKIKITEKFLIKKSLDASHHIGGTIFHPKKSNAFVDKNLRINGLRNIYISSSSNFPTSGSANPTATILALSLRLANFLKNQK